MNGLRKNISDEELHNLSLILGYDPAVMKREFMGDQWRTHGDITRLLLDRLQPAVAEQVNGLLLKIYKSPYTEHILPLRRLGDDEPISFRWNTYTYEQGIANEIEQEGLARLHSSTKTEHGARMVRRGLAIKIEENFYRTPEGMARYREQIEQMATSILRTHEMDIMLSLLQTPALNLLRTKEDNNQIYGLDIGLRADERLQRQIDCFGMVNKNNDMGFTNMTAFLIGQMRNRGVDPDCLIVPPNLLNYYYATNPALNNYSQAGTSAAHSRDIATGGGYGPNGFRRDEFNGLRVVDTYVQRMVEGAQQSVSELLTVNKQIGEFYPMLTKYSVEEIEGFNKRNKIYSGKMRNIYIYDEDLDRKVRVDYTDAVENCMRWKPEGTLDPDTHAGLKNDIFTHTYTNPRGESITECVNTFGEISENWISNESLDRVVDTMEHYFKENFGSLQSFFNPLGDLTFEIFNKELTRRPTLFHSKVVGSGVDLKNKIAAIISLMQDPSNDRTPLESTKLAETNTWIDNFYKSYYEENIIPTELGVTGTMSRGAFFGKSATDKSFFQIASVRDHIRKIFRLIPVTKQNILALHKRDIYIPIDFVLARPYMTYETSSAIILKAGQVTGETLISQERFQMTTNVADRMLYANVFYYGKAIVRKPRNVVVAPNVFIQKYLFGNNTKFITSKSIEQIETDGGIVTSQNRESILAFATRVNDDIMKHNVMDIRGVNRDFSDNFCGKLATHEFYNKYLKITDEKISSFWSNHQDYENRQIEPNTVCMLGHVEDSERRVISYCTGHLGRVTVDGIGSTRKPGMYGSKALVSVISNEYAKN